MRIAYFVPSLGTAEGQGNVDLELLRRIARAGNHVDVFASNVPEVATTIPDVRVRRIPRLPRWQLGNQLLLLAGTTLRARRRHDLVHADAGVTLRRADVMVCHTISDKWYELPDEIWREPGIRGRHAAGATRFKARLELRQYRAARAVVVAARQTADDLARRGVDPSRIHLMPFGVDSSRFRPPSPQERAAARAAWGIDRDAFVTLLVGAHGPRKGLPVALDALAAAQPGEVLLVAGEHRGGGWAETAAARALPVVMPGKLGDVRPAYWASDVLLYPSRYDAFGMAVLEAMACGLPVVVSREAGSHEIVRDAGFVLNVTTTEALRAAVDALRRDHARRTAMGGRAREIAAAHTWDKAGQMLLDLYARLIEPAGTRVISGL